MILRPGEVPIGSLYDLMVCAIAPRPIALVSTVDAAGRRNLAPFSFFVFGGMNPPSVCICPASRKDGTDKDTLRGIEETGEFVIGIVTRELIDAMNATASDHPGADEWALSGFTPAAASMIAPPLIAECRVQFECRLFQVIRHGAGPMATNYVIGEVVCAHTDPAIWNDGVVIPASLRPVGRMGGAEYVDLAGPEIFELARPK